MAALAVVAVAGPAWAGVPYVTDDPGTPAAGRFEINVVSLLTELHDDTTGAFSSLEVNYGITDHFQSHFFVPIGFDDASGSAVRVGTGDVELGFKYRFFDGDDLGGWNVGTAPSVIVPPAGLSHQFGTGTTHLFAPLLVARQWGAWTLFGEAGYAFNPGRGNRNWECSYLAFAYDINPRVTVGAEILYNTSQVVGVDGGTGFNVTTTYNISETYHLLASVGRNITHASALNEFTTLLGVQFTF